MKHGNRVAIVIGVLGALLVAVLLGHALAPNSPDGDRATERRPRASPSKQEKAKAKRNVVEKPADRAGAQKSRERRIVTDEYSDMSGADRKLAEAVQDAMESDDHRKIIAAAVAALKSANPEVRRDATDALGWCGKDALAELTGLLADSDDDLRDSAITHWECALSEVDEPELRYKTALSVMGTITEPDALDSISGQFGSAAQEYIDEVEDESEQNVRRAEVVQMLYGIIDGPTPICAEKAKEAYSDLTGHEWVSAEEAEKYLANPDEYEQPED